MQLYLEHHTNTESTAVRNLKPERWGSPLVQGEKNQGEEACGESRNNNNNNNNNNKAKCASISKIANAKYKTSIMGSGINSTIKFNHETAAKLYYIETCFVPRM